ncbi:MAG: hypothetical protein H5T60_03790 [Anaerolineae bacterium]|jgi:hypothetical protein|nr:hypothetical protein [Anaerolineae bacterium]
MVEHRQCVALTRAGRRCRRRAVSGSAFCRQHLQRAEVYAAGPFAALFTPEEMSALLAVENAPSVDDVVPVLLVAIRRALESGAPANVVVRACEAYVRALRERRQAQERPGPAGEDSLGQALEAISGELGVEL